MDTEHALYREHRGIDIAVHAHQVEQGNWLPRVVLFEPTIGDSRELTLNAAPHEGFADADTALAAGMRWALEAVDRMHDAAGFSG